MKTLFWSACLVAVFGSTPNAAWSEELLVSGTYMRGSNFTEPRPVKSKYLETIRGGVVVVGEKAGFFLLVKPRRNFGRSVYATIEYENPSDPVKPLVNDMNLPPTGGQFDFSSPDFVHGLRINTEYTIIVRVFEVRGAKEPFDVLKQKVRSYVDNTGAELKVLGRLKPVGQAKSVPECWNFAFDGREWVAGNQGIDARRNLHEYILKGERIGDWSELVTSYFELKRVTPQALFEQMRQDLNKNCETLQISIIEETPDSMIFEWRHGGCNGYTAQHELRRIDRTAKGTLMLSYVAKTHRLTDEVYGRWLGILKAATPLN